MSLSWVPISRCVRSWPFCNTEFLYEHWLLYQSMCSPPDFEYLSDFLQHYDPFLYEKRSVDLLSSVRKLRLQDFLIRKQYQDVSIAYTDWCKPFLPIKMSAQGQNGHLEETPLFVQARDVVFVLIANTLSESKVLVSHSRHLIAILSSQK